MLSLGFGFLPRGWEVNTNPIPVGLGAASAGGRPLSKYADFASEWNAGIMEITCLPLFKRNTGEAR